MIEGMNYYWPTPILKDTISDKNILNETVNYILTNFTNEDLKVSLSMKDENLFSDKNYNDFKNKIVIPSFQKYIKLQNIDIDLSKKEFFVKGWITGNKSSYFVPKHNHSGSMLSAVFYLLCEEQNQGGALAIHDPRHNANRGYTSEFNSWFEKIRFFPKSGDILIFPSFAYHSVETFFGKMRLAVPVDLFLKDD